MQIHQFGRSNGSYFDILRLPAHVLLLAQSTIAIAVASQRKMVPHEMRTRGRGKVLSIISRAVEPRRVTQSGVRSLVPLARVVCRRTHSTFAC